MEVDESYFGPSRVRVLRGLGIGRSDPPSRGCGAPQLFKTLDKPRLDPILGVPPVSGPLIRSPRLRIATVITDPKAAGLQELQRKFF